MRRTLVVFFLVLISIAAVGCAEDASTDKDASVEPADAQLSLSRDSKSDAPTPYRGELDWGTTQIDDLTAQLPYHSWGFTVAPGENIFIDLASREGNDTFAILYRADDNGQFHYLAHNDDCYGQTLNSCIELTEVEGGDYLVVATSYDYMAFNYRARFQYHLTLFCQSEDGECGVVDHPTLCGSRGLAPCPAGEYCNWDESAMCGAADEPGVCTPLPQNCYEIYAPVCGCDGQTYSNDCYAAAAGVDVASDGACTGGTQGHGEGEICGGIAGFRCADGLTCDYSANTACFPDAAGECVKSTQIYCTQQYDPVCGCDGVTYGNDCVRRSALVALAHTGACE